MIILSGSDSLLAQSILPLLREKTKVFAFDHTRGSINDSNFLAKLADETKASFFINCAEMNNAEECAYKREEAYSINSFAAGEIAKVCKNFNIKLIHISSSFVYSGKENITYSENDTTDPQNVLGDSKLFGEKKIIESGCDHIILRIPQIYGKGNSFITDVLRESNGSRLIKGQIISSLYSKDAASIIDLAIEKNITGTYNASNLGGSDIFEFFNYCNKLLEKYSGKNIVAKFTPIDYADFLSASEPILYNALNNSEIETKLGIKLRTWQEALEEYIIDYHQFI